MCATSWVRRFIVTVAVAAGIPLVVIGGSSADSFDQRRHPAAGSWFGRAVQLCPTGADPAVNCAGLGPAFDLYMTPTLTADGTFLGNDSMAVGDPPFGPHTTAHGSWVATGRRSFRADYVFMLPTIPPLPGTVSGIRFQWQGRVVDKDTAVGHVNIHFQPPLALGWTPLADHEFPALPPEAQGLVTAPAGFVYKPDACSTPGCPLVFKFTIKRVTQ